MQELENREAQREIFVHLPQSAIQVHFYFSAANFRDKNKG